MRHPPLKREEVGQDTDLVPVILRVMLTSVLSRVTLK